MNLEEVARASADALAEEYGPELVAEVELELAAAKNDARETFAVDPISLAGLIVSVAALAWQIYKDTRPPQTAEGDRKLAEAIRARVKEDAIATPEEREKVILTVVQVCRTRSA